MDDGVQKDLFSKDQTGDHPKLAALYEKAKRDFWNETTDIEWDAPLEMSKEKREALARVLSITYWGERAARTVAAQLVSQVEDEDARQALSAQVIEEAKHVAAFHRLLLRLDRVYPPSFFAKKLLRDLIETQEPIEKMVGMHLFIENIANHTFHTLSEAVEDKTTKSILDMVARDEAKHVAIGVLYLPALLERVPAYRVPHLQMKQLKWLTYGIAMVKDGYQPARVLDLDLARAGQRALKEHYRIRERMQSNRGLLDIPGFDRAIDAIGSWATPN